MFSESLCFSPSEARSGKKMHFHAADPRYRELVFRRNGGNESFTTFLATAIEDFAPLGSCHPGTETVSVGAFNFAGLECAFHLGLLQSILKT